MAFPPAALTCVAFLLTVRGTAVPLMVTVQRWLIPEPTTLRIEKIARPVAEEFFGRKKMVNWLKIKEKNDMTVLHKR
jgi:hypothetical protein